jgi:hypothetical protein
MLIVTTTEGEKGTLAVSHAGVCTRRCKEVCRTWHSEWAEEVRLARHVVGNDAVNRLGWRKGNVRLVADELVMGGEQTMTRVTRVTAQVHGEASL